MGVLNFTHPSDPQQRILKGDDDPRKASLPAGEKAAAQGTVSDDDDPEILAKAFLPREAGAKKKYFWLEMLGERPPPSIGPLQGKNYALNHQGGNAEKHGIAWDYVALCA